MSAGSGTRTRLCNSTTRLTATMATAAASLTIPFAITIAAPAMAPDAAAVAPRYEALEARVVRVSTVRSPEQDDEHECGQEDRDRGDERAGQAEHDHPYATILDFRGDRIWRSRAYFDRAEALRPAGLSE